MAPILKRSKRVKSKSTKTKTKRSKKVSSKKEPNRVSPKVTGSNGAVPKKESCKRVQANKPKM